MPFSKEAIAAYNANRKTQLAVTRSLNAIPSIPPMQMTVEQGIKQIKAVLSDAETPAVKEKIAHFFVELREVLQEEVKRLDAEADNL